MSKKDTINSTQVDHLLLCLIRQTRQVFLHALRVPLAAQIVLHVLPGLREQLVPLQLRRKIKRVLGEVQMP